MANFKRRKMSKRMPLSLKYWYRGMAKTNYRQQPKRRRYERRTRIALDP